MERRYSKWRKLDNAALAFPLVTGKNDTRVFRFYCELKETVQPEILQDALDQTMEKYPLFQAVLRKGLFWFYLERRDIRPLAKEEKKPPCSRLYIPDKKSLLFEVTYYEKRINFEVFHALTDGTGAMNFLLQLVQNYLILAHPESPVPRIPEEEKITPGDQEEDSFSQYYNSDTPRHKKKKPAAVRLKGEKLAHDEMQILEAAIPVKEILKKARSYGASITAFLSAVLICAIHEEIPRSRQKKPVALMVPVNLRNYFPSQSMGNFFGWIEVGYTFSENTTFREVLDNVKKQFETELVKEKIAEHMSGYVRLEKNPIIRAVPLEVKRYFLMVGAELGSRSITSVYSNIGVIRLPEEYENYIERFGFFASTNSLQLCSCSYGEELLLGLTSKIPDDSIQRNFLKILKREGIPFQEEYNDFPGCGEEQKQESKKLVQTFTFLCIAAAVICGMINYITLETLNWFWFAAAGCLCAWLVVMVAYTKRRNILKNEMWQLLIITVIAVLWDSFTGWRGWSLDFVLPFGAMAVLGSMPVIARVSRLEPEEYLFYLVQAAIAGCIPVILVWTGVVHFRYPSVICSGISFLVLAGLFIFQRKNMLREFRKKLRM
ncbi:MAG TPA: alcohol acetyltransferase [Candidatus Blautia excrementipullorum]|nr:alcohol acetyltransferase [Candidatus Blautia excrementipullorum]